MPEFHLGLVNFITSTLGVFCGMQFLIAESCTSELRPNLFNTNHMFIHHFLDHCFHMVVIRRQVLKLSSLVPLLGL